MLKAIGVILSAVAGLILHIKLTAFNADCKKVAFRERWAEFWPALFRGDWDVVCRNRHFGKDE